MKTYHSFTYKGVTIHGCFEGDMESYLVTMTHGTRAFSTLLKAQRYITKTLKEITQ